MPATVRLLTPADLPLYRELMALFGAVFDDPSSYASRPPSDDYARRLLARDTFLALVAQTEDGRVIGGLAAYELPKFEQARSELYIYDLGVDAEYRRQGVATALIAELQRIGRDRGASVIFVQADTTVDDEPAIALYSKLGEREDVLHFDIAVSDDEHAGLLAASHD